MRPVIVLLAVLAVSCHANSFASVCDTCKSIVQNFVDSSSNPSKLAELKVSLSTLCAGTSHQNDCAQTLSHFDFIAKKLAPYFRDTNAVCSKIQMCGASETDFSAVPRVAMLFLKKVKSQLGHNLMMKREVCEECKYASNQIRAIFGSSENQMMTRAFVSQFVCKTAGAHRNACEMMNSNLVPAMFDEFEKFFASAEAVCGDMEFCEAPKKAIQQPHHAQSIEDVWSKMGVLTTGQGEELMSCFECTLSADTLLETLLAKRQVTADTIQKVVCSKVVGNWTAGCNDFVHMYLSTVLYMTYNQFTGKELCTIIKTCEKKKSELFFKPDEETRQLGCSNCAQVESFFAHNAMELHSHATEGLFNTVCQKMPVSFHSMCQRAANMVSGRALHTVSQMAKDQMLCQAIC